MPLSIELESISARISVSELDSSRLSRLNRLTLDVVVTAFLGEIGRVTTA